MSFDISRSSFRPRGNFLGVVMQQGRVQLDSDWNEWQSEYSRRIQAGTLDTIGPAVYPASTPNAFNITSGANASGNTLFIGAGRYYVDGLLAENHGPESQAAWDDALAEMSGAPAFATTNTAQTDYTQQPYLPNPTLPAAGQICVAYLDVWQRDVTYLEDPHLIDKAVNIDTTGRLQTIWQVKLLNLGNPSSTPDCSTDIPAFDALSAPPAGRLTSGLVPNATSGPCCLAPNTGYTGQENQLYRVEIHAGGTPAAPPAGGYSGALPAGTPTFKWSRDNASVQTSVSAISTVTTSSGSVSQLTVASLGRDQVLGFAVNDWIEITDDAYELLNQAGEIYQITGVTAANNTITISGAVSSHFPLTGGQTNPKLHTRITRWDQSGQVYSTDTSGNLTPWYDLSAPDAAGVIPVPPTGAGAALVLVLENGVTVSFDLSPEPTAANPTAFRVADYWLFTARAADGSVETITEAPPLGINHHYAKLAIVTFPSTITPCRIEWPPSASGSSCCCSITVSPGDLTGETTLQSILSNYQGVPTPTTICLEPGTYSLPAPLRLTSAYANITLEACRPGTVTLQALAGNESQFNDGLIVLDNSASITLSGLTLLVPPSPYSASTFAGLASSALPSSLASMVRDLLVSVGVRIVGGDDISIQNCTVLLADSRKESFKDNTAVFAAGIFLNGETVGVTVRGCEFRAGNVKLWKGAQARSMALYTGVAMAPSVAFTSPAATAATDFSGAIVDANNPVEFAAKVAPEATPQVKPAAKAEVAKPEIAKPEAKLAGTGETTVLAKTPTLSISSGASTVMSSIAAGSVSDRPGLQNIGGTVQNIFNFGNSTPPALAAQGGIVLPATLDQAVITGNTFTNLSSAALLLGEIAGLDASDNQVNCVAGFWALAPSQVQVLLSDPQSLALVGATVALAMPLPQGDSSTTVMVPAATPSVYLYTGKNSSGYQDSYDNTWLPDTSVHSVTITASPGTTDWLYNPSPAPTIEGTPDPTLYQNERAGPSFSYTFTGLNPGFYSVTLDFAEIYYKTYPDAGIRIFDVSINGVPVLTNFDIGATVGPLVAYSQTFTNIPSSNGQIVVQLTGTNNGSDHNAKINALSLSSVSSGAPFLGPGNESDSTLFFDQLAQVAWQSYTSISLQARWRFDSNEMQSLSATGILLLDDDNLFNDNSGSLMLTGNRIDGQIQRQYYYAAEDVAANSQAGVRAGAQTFTSGNISAFEYNVYDFVALVAVSAVSRSVITSNMLTNGNNSIGHGPCLLVVNSTVQEAFVTIMSNLFAGYISVPARNISDTTLDAYAQSWNFLNTTT
jgi:Family of unknown function (DUF6519)/Malectin domain